MKLLLVFLLIGCASATPKKKAGPPEIITHEHYKMCLEKGRELAEDRKMSDDEILEVCKCALKITTDMDPDFSTKIRIYNECIK